MADEELLCPYLAYRLPEHRRIAEVLRMMRADTLLSAECWFGGGTAIALKHDEYRLSLDIDFLCSSQDGYRTLRQAITAIGCAALFSKPVKTLRDFRCDQYGLRTAIEHDGQPIKIEIVREGRINLIGAQDTCLGVPLLSLEDQFAEKILANSDRGSDPAVCYRDAFDLGILILNHGDRIPVEAIAKAQSAYGADVWRDARRVVSYLDAHPDELLRASATLRMDVLNARKAIDAVARACTKQDAS